MSVIYHTVTDPSNHSYAQLVKINKWYNHYSISMVKQSAESEQVEQAEVL